ncbi:MAG: YSIRK-type signal peptide-containing protein, partial [Aerococcus sp.]|nr:YSIRK-type signal peptide-containing protein [Aerococcus sp.]
MVGKNNKDLLTRKMSKRITRWGIRRLNIGVASIAIASGFLISGGLSEIAHAAEVQPQSATTADSEKITAGKEATYHSLVADEENGNAGDQADSASTENTVTTDGADTTADVDVQASQDQTEAAQQADTTAKEDAKADDTTQADKDTATDDATTDQKATDEDKDATDTDKADDQQSDDKQTDADKDQAKQQAAKAAAEDRAADDSVPDYTNPDSVSKITDIDKGFDRYGDLTREPYDYGNTHTEVIRFNKGDYTSNREVNSLLNLKNKIDFSHDFSMNYYVAMDPQGNTTGPDGFGFIFYNDTPQNLMNAGGILRNKGLKNAWGFRYDTAYHSYDPNDEQAKQDGAGFRGYGAFAKNDASGTTTLVGKSQIINYATNSFTGFRGQNLNLLTIKYDAAAQTLTVTYNKMVWTATLTDLGADANQAYGFAIMSTKGENRYSATGDSIQAAGDSIIEYQPEASEQNATIKYVDDKTGNTLKTETIKGNSGTTSDYRTQPSIQDYLNKGYEFVSDTYPSNGVVFDNDSSVDQAFEVHFKHKTESVTPEKPGNAPVDQLIHKVTQTVHYVDADEEKLQNDVTDEVTFQREGTRDLVTNEVTFGDWEAVKGDNTFDVKKSPVITGYYADKAQVDKQTVDQSTTNQEVTVTYNKLGSLVPDAPNSKPVQYPNDPNDPTKPGDPIIPDIPGYTPVDPNTNKPLTPGEEYPI